MGICTLQWPNLDVLFFNLNNQNVLGIAQTYRSIKSNALGREIPTLLVASPIPEVPEEMNIRRERFEFARNTIGASTDLILPFDPFVCFKEAILTGDTPLARAYDLLTNEIVKKNPTDVSTMLEEAKRLFNQGTFDLADLRYQEIVEAKPQDFKAWLEYSRFQRLRCNFKLAVQHFASAHALRPGDQEILSQLAATHLENGDIEKASDYLFKFLEASDSHQQIGTLAKAFDRSGAHKAAIRAYERVLALTNEALSK